MSARTRQYWSDAEDRWPALQQFLACHLHQDWPVEYRTSEDAIDAAVADSDMPRLVRVCRDWTAWNNAAGWRDDVDRSIGEGLGVNLLFPDGVAARQFMNGVYDKLVVAIRKVEPGWKP